MQLPGLIGVAVGAFAVTNFDAFVVMVALYSASPSHLTRVLTVGQVLGSAATLAITAGLAAALGPLPTAWFGLFGLVPLVIGLHGFVRARRRAGDEKHYDAASSMAAVATLTVAVGADNVGVLVPLFRELGSTDRAISVCAVFLVLDVIACAIAVRVGRTSGITRVVAHLDRWLAPAVYVAVGVAVLAHAAVDV